MMGKEEFREMAIIHGADLARWPDDLRAEATRMAAEPWAAALLVELADIERHIAASDVAEPSPDRIGRAIAGTLGRIAAPRPTFGRLLAWVVAGAGGLAASTALGIVLALHGPLAPPAVDPIAFVVEAGDLTGIGG